MEGKGELIRGGAYLIFGLGGERLFGGGRLFGKIRYYNLIGCESPLWPISDPLFLFTKRKSFKNSPGKVNFLLIKLKQNKTKQSR